MVKQTRSLFSVDVIGLEPEPRPSVSARICERIRIAITSGALAPNSRVPSSRTLARDLGVARNTVDAALSQLVADGYLVRHRGAGSFVAEHIPERERSPVKPSRGASFKRLSTARRVSERARSLQAYPGHHEPSTAAPFTPSLPPADLFPRKVWNRLLHREASRAGHEYWQYGASNGLRTLREAIAAHTSAMRATRCSPDQVVVVTSTQQAVELAGRVLADPGDHAWVETPGYPPAQHCLRAAGLSVMHVPVDEAGLNVEAAEAMAPDARLAYVTPSHQYPTGYEMSMERRRSLLYWASRHDAYIVEDDYDGDYRYEGRPIASLQGMDRDGRVIYVGSFNKILFPGLRIAYAIVPTSLAGAFTDAKHVADGHTALLAQGVLAAFIHEGHLARHIRKTRAIYDERRLIFLQEATVLADLIEFGPARAGMHVTGFFKQRMDDRATAATCARAGVLVHPLSRYGETERGGLVFGFAAASRATCRNGLAIVREVMTSGAL